MKARAAVVLGVMSLACPARSGPSQVATGHLAAWLECHDCTRGELDSLAPHAAVLRDTLIVILRRGPPPARQDSLRRRLGAVHRALAARASHQPGASHLPDSATFVAHYQATLRESYQQRAARALSIYGGAPGRVALEDAARDSLAYDPVTRIVIRRARDTALVRFP